MLGAPKGVGLMVGCWGLVKRELHAAVDELEEPPRSPHFGPEVESAPDALL